MLEHAKNHREQVQSYRQSQQGHCSKVSTSSSTQAVSSDVAELKDMVRALILDKKNQTPAPPPIKAVEQSCVTCGGGHSYQNCPATDGNIYRDNIQEYVSQAAAVNYNQGNASYRPQMVANQIRPPGFPPMQNIKTKQPKSGINFNQIGGKNFTKIGVLTASMILREDTVYLEELLSVINSDPNLPPSLVCEINVPEKVKSSCKDPPDLEHKDLPSILKYAILEGDDRITVHHSLNNLKERLKPALIKSLGTDISQKDEKPSKKQQNRTRDGKVCEDEAQSKSRTDYANLGNFIYKRKKGEKGNEKKKDVEGLFLPSHEGYRNTIELPEGNNVVPLRSDTIMFMQNGCKSEDPNQHLKDFLKLMDSLDVDVANRERTRMRLFQFSLRDQASN
ncbi:hypothetical protein Tco_1547084 [Tanacetum coccineum]